MVENLKPWLSATARNKAKNKLREVHADLPLDAGIVMEGECKLDMPLCATLYVSDFILLIL